MQSLVVLFLIIALLAVLFALGRGLYYMSKGEQKDYAKKSNKMMWKRITYQAIALVLFAVVLILSGKG